MRQFVAVAFLSVLAFAAGYEVRIWVDHTRPLPAPPVVGGEFVDGSRPAAAAASYVPVDRADLVARIEHLRPQIETFNQGVHAIDAEFDAKMQALLTPQQHEYYVARKKRNNRPLRGGTDPLTDQEINALRDRPLFGVADHVSVEWKLSDLDKDLKFNPDQRERMRQYLIQRREKFIALIDNVPVPSLQLMSLAPIAQRLAAVQPAAAEAKP